MLDKVAETIKRYKMLADGERVCVALSGGADSVSLLYAMKELGYDVFAAHVNHNLRGEQSDRDERFCVDLCRKLGVKLFTDSVDVKGYCEKNRTSLEEGARALRYEALRSHLDGCKLCTAHNLNDCFETTLFNLVRGSGLSGLAGIPAVRDDIVRPLIEVTRSEIEQFLSERNQDYVTDSTNLEDNCSRNIIRLNVMPELERINPSLLKNYKRTLHILLCADEYLSDAAEKMLDKAFDGSAYALDVCGDEAVLNEMILKILRREKIEPSFERVDAIKKLAACGGVINIKKDVYVVCNEGKISFETRGEGSKARDFCIKTDLTAPVFTNCHEIEFTRISQFHISDYNKRELKYLIDPDKLSGDVFVRSYCGNEKIRLLGKGFSQTVKKLLASTPPSRRKDVIVMADEHGAFYVQGFGVDERAACGESTVSAIRPDIK